MNKIINSKTVFCNYHEISISDGISHDGLELSIRNMENPKEYVSVPLSKEASLLLFKLLEETLNPYNFQSSFKGEMFKEKRTPQRLVWNESKTDVTYVIGADPYEKELKTI